MQRIFQEKCKKTSSKIYKQLAQQNVQQKVRSILDEFDQIVELLH